MEKLSWQTRIAKRRTARAVRIVVALLCFLTTQLVAQAITLSASLERETVTLGESVRLSIMFEGGQPQGTPSLPTIANLQIVYNGPSSQFSFVNGQTSSSITHNYTVTPRQPGNYTIPALTVEVGGQKLTTQPLHLTVLKPNALPPEAMASGTQPAFLRLQLPKTNLYFGEIIMGEYQLYLRDGIVGINQFQFTATPAEGLSVGKFIEGQRRRTQVGNIGYTVVPLYFVLTPVKTGPLSIGPVTANVVIELPPSGNRRRDSFFDAFFNSNERKQLALATDTINLQCLPLPEQNKPADFSGAVGNYTMTVNVGPTNVATGDPITVRVEITGRGALDAVKLPAQSAWENFKSYPPTANVEFSDQLGMQGRKIFEQIISPENADIKELPPFSFSFFDPETAQYRTLTHPDTPLVVRPGGHAPAPVVAATSHASNDTPPPQQDIVPIKTRLGNVRSAGSFIGTRKVFLALNVVPMLAFIGAIVWRKRTDALANNPRLRRQRQVAATIDAGLKRLETLAAQNTSDEFFAELVHLLQEKLGERLNCSASSITEAVIDEKLRPRGLPDTTLDELHALFQSCNLARYAPVKSSEELAGIIPRLTTALKQLEEVK
ncbi:MAG TPA: BatD family protein [Verrucomicrobiae bacterium]|nr:BatD family protein [Verrucomicrobiae bacterium]